MDHSVEKHDDSGSRQPHLDSTMHTLILMAHGSRREASNREVAQLADRLRLRLDGYDRVTHAFLELADPDLESAAQAAIIAGATRLTVFPYFLVAGRHVAEDIPAQVDALQRAHPGMAIKLLDYFGNGTAIDEMVATRIITAVSQPDR